MSFEVLKGGIEATIQDYPGRLGYWAIGIPPSGPADDYSFRLANRLVGNEPGEAGIEVTAGLLTIKLRSETVIALTGANMQAKLNGMPAPFQESISVKEGDVLALSIAKEGGFRSYIAFSGGINVPDYLGSKSTFAAGGFGGFEGRVLKPGDVIKMGNTSSELSSLAGRRLKDAVIPKFSTTLEVEVMVGPQASPDFVLEEDVESFLSEVHKVDRNSNRLGYRLAQRKWKWSRSDGGVAGKHPSNIIDNGYTVGSVNISGDQPIILLQDGPSAGGFICLCCVISAGMWKVGQAAPGRDVIKFKKVTYSDAIAMKKRMESSIQDSIN